MKFHIITLPFDRQKQTFDTRELDAFCARANIHDRRIAFFRTQEQVFWTVFLHYEPVSIPSSPAPKAKPKEPQADPLEEKCLSALKRWRNEEALKSGFPPYIIASNALLEVIVRKRPATLSAILDIRGFGKQKAAKYGQPILDILNDHFPS
jgi:superfamily II DNA helicase RecQ